MTLDGRRADVCTLTLLTTPPPAHALLHLLSPPVPPPPSAAIPSSVEPPALYHIQQTDIRTMHGSDFEIVVAPGETDRYANQPVVYTTVGLSFTPQHTSSCCFLHPLWLLSLQSNKACLYVATCAHAGESCLCGMNAQGVIDYQDDTCSTCTCSVCPPPVNNAPNWTSPYPSPPPPPGSSPSPPSPPPVPDDPNILRFNVQTGTTVTLLNGSSVVYNGTIDPRISTQYNESYNSYQGVTQVGVTAHSWTTTSRICIAYATRHNLSSLIHRAHTGTHSCAKLAMT